MTKSVLIVEDEFLIAIDLELLLESHGWHVIGPAATVKDALKLLEGAAPSAALLDVNLGGEPVTAVAEALVAMNVPFAVASAHSDPERVGGRVLKGVLKVPKPTSERHLLAVLDQLLKP